MAFLGGLGSVSGPVVGALIVEPVQQYFTLRFTGGGLSLILFGVLFLVVIRFLPDGIVPSLGGVLRRRLRQDGGTGADPGLAMKPSGAAATAGPEIKGGVAR
jgi:branched-chain amino acid transport system permease protein